MKRFFSVIAAASLLFGVFGCETQMQEGQEVEPGGGVRQEGEMQQDTTGGQMDTTLMDTAAEGTEEME